ncbi:MAG: cupin domain-containing protein [Bacteroidota bacterium]
MSNFNHSTLVDFRNEISYAENSIVSKRILEKSTGNITLFAFDKDQKLSEHTAPFDALVQCIEGQIKITIGDKEYELKDNDSILMPANIPHSVYATEKFKMLLTMIKQQE